VTGEALRDGPATAAILKHRLIVVLRRVEPRDRLLELVDELADAGARCIEVTLDAPSATDDLAAVRERLAARDAGPFLVGAGTVRSTQQLDEARWAGADFGVSPVLDHVVLRHALDAGIPFIPGALTPTEIGAAWDAGATFVKLFPASAVGPAMVRELRGPLPDVRLVPTGGVAATNARAFLEAGAAAVGIGGAIVRASAAERRELVRSLAGAATP
jgi:2-dehydro-3-deoxyphosphogluconate aldolase/(4S)-4-hydroxy-2-oxoglutarate aldolase